MNGIYEGVIKYYSNNMGFTAHYEPTADKMEITRPRLEYNFWAVIAIAQCIYKVAASILLLVATSITLCSVPQIKASLFKNGKEALIYGCAVPFGFAGAIFPEKISKKLSPPEMLTNAINTLKPQQLNPSPPPCLG